MEQTNEGKITLMDGSVIQGYTPQRITDEQLSNHLELDTTGEYLQIRRKPQAEKPKAEDKEWRFFTENAFFFLSHSREILSDSRMFLARVPVVNGLAYTGTSGFRVPTLGVYLEWWASCGDSLVELDGEKWLVWFISGSPLTGSNACAIVNEKGEVRRYTKLNFKNVWSSFMSINTRYDEAKVSYAYFTLEEVVNIVRNNDEDKAERKLMLDCFFYRSFNRELTDRLQKSEERCRKLTDELAEARIRLNLDWYRGLYREVKEAEEAYIKRREQLKAQRRELRKRLKSGELTNIEYQHLLQPISKELRTTADPSFSFDWDLRQKGIGVTLYDVEKFFKNENKQDGHTKEEAL